MLAAIIVAAGTSQRLGFDKIAAMIAGKSVLDHSVHAFSTSPSVSEIIVVTRADRVDEVRGMLKPIGKRVVVVAGGAERQDSVRHGLKALRPDVAFIAVHDAARPLITPEEIEAVYMAAREHGAASLAAPVPDTLKRADKDGFVNESIDRRDVFGMQTPQIFSRDLLEQAYARVGREQAVVTDEASAVELAGHRVFLVSADGPNFKITFQRDLDLAEVVLRQRLSVK